MAEGGGLLNRYTLQRRIEGSNPSGSASPIESFIVDHRHRDAPVLRRVIVAAKSNVMC